MKTVGGKALAEIGYANSVSVGKAEALGVVTAVLRNDSDPFGNRVDGLLGMSFLSRFNIQLSPTAIELTAIPIGEPVYRTHGTNLTDVAQLVHTRSISLPSG